MRVNGPATEDGVLTEDQEEVLEPGIGHDQVLGPYRWNQDTDEVTRDPFPITVKPPERPV